MESQRCQSCGMPLSEELAGTNKNKSPSLEYCKYCFASGQFTKPNLKLKDAIELSVEHMIKEMGLNREEAEYLANKTIPKLSRWKR